jgi:arylsulfatase A-like enzyme
MLTGLNPREHGGIRLRLGGHKDLPGSVTTLPEILRWNGYATGAVISNWQAARGLWRGFDRFVERQPGKRQGSVEGKELDPSRAEGVVDDAIRWLEDERDFGSGEPAFSWLLFRDVHEPVDAARHVKRIPPECRGIQPLPVRWEGIRKSARRRGAAEPPNMRCRRALYREALRYIDEQLGRLILHLERSGRAARTAVIVVSDHGEEFWDHAAEELAVRKTVQIGYGHGHTLYAELVRVPLLVVPPGGLGGAATRSDRLVSVRDVFATLLGMAGAQLPARSRSLDLRRLLPGGDEASTWRTYVVSETTMYGPDRYSVSTGELRAITTVGGQTLVFDRHADPLEKSPLPADSPLAKRGVSLLQSVIERDHGYSRPSATDIQALRALGYVP